MSKVTDAIHKELDSLEFRLQNGETKDPCYILRWILGDIMKRAVPFLPKKGHTKIKLIYYQYDQLHQRAKALLNQYCGGP